MVAVWVGTKTPTSPKSAEILRLRSGQEGARTRREAGRSSKPKRTLGRKGMDITWLTDRIAVGGGIWNAENMAKVAEVGITHVLDMQLEFDDTPLAAACGIAVLWNPTDDDFEPKSVELFQRGVKFAQTALEAEGKLYIHCAAGVHRGPMMAAAVLGSLGWELGDAIRLIEVRRPLADFPEVYVKSVEEFLDKRDLATEDAEKH
jgi:protein-tyrosine phosphatase